MKNIIFLAPPAAGKGTCSEILKNEFNYEHISTGAILRSEIASQSSLGNEIKSIIEKGNLVDDSLMIKLIENKLANINNSFILDGFPRTINQAYSLDNLFKELNIENYIVIYLNIDKSLALKRTLGRMTCPKCGKGYNIYFDGFKPNKDGYCDICNEALSKRSDDNEESFNNRFETYINSTLPILKFYEQKNKVIKIDVDNNFELLSSKLKEIVSD